jgi:hypothetical protein
MKTSDKTSNRAPTRAEGKCLCGAVVVEIGVPARWAWHDHSSATRRAHGAAYATYVGTWASRFRFIKGEDNLTHYEDKERGGVRQLLLDMRIAGLVPAQPAKHQRAACAVRQRRWP